MKVFTTILGTKYVYHKWGTIVVMVMVLFIILMLRCFITESGAGLRPGNTVRGVTKVSVDCYFKILSPTSHT